MKSKITMMLAFIFLAAYSVSAQMQRMSVEERVKMTMDKLSPLKLDKDQKKKASEVFTNYMNSQQKIMQEAREKGERPDMSVFQKATEERDAALKGIFTDDQYKLFKDKIEETLRPQRRGGNGNNR